MDTIIANTSALSEYTNIGKISKTYGFEGGVQITLNVDNPEDFELMESVFVEYNGKLVPFFINTIAFAGKTNLRLTFFDYNSDKKIEEFVGCSLYLPNESFPESEDEVDESIKDFIGFSAIDLITNKSIGKIIRIIDNPAHPLFEIEQQQGKCILVPAVEAFITAIDLSKKTISFTLPQGLLEL